MEQEYGHDEGYSGGYYGKVQTGKQWLSNGSVNLTWTIYNTTGETVTELYLIDNLTGEKGVNYAVNGFAADACWVITRTITPEEKEAGYSMTLYFKTEGGYEGQFATLHIEVAPIYLLSADGMTGATQISFRAPAAE